MNKKKKHRLIDGGTFELYRDQMKHLVDTFGWDSVLDAMGERTLRRLLGDEYDGVREKARADAEQFAVEGARKGGSA